MTKQVREHTCFQKEHPLSPVNCNCRKYIDITEADRLVAEGIGQNIVKSYKTLTVEEVCPTCAGDEKLKRSCTHCRTTGTVQVNRQLPVYGEDIIVTVSPQGKRKSNRIAQKTPRSPTIEEGHILRSVGAIDGQKRVAEDGFQDTEHQEEKETKRIKRVMQAAVDRIDEYEMLTLKERMRLLVNANVLEFEAAFRTWIQDVSKEFPLPLRLEPEDNAKKGEGRLHDFGRPI